MKVSIQRVKSLLEEKGIRPSVQRLSILKYVMESANHPSVDSIYKDLLPLIPTLSKTTVYNTLKQLTSRGLLNALLIDETRIHYDFAEHKHAHFICVKCGGVQDVEIDFSMLESIKLDQFEIIDTLINFRGICKDCQTQGEV